MVSRHQPAVCLVATVGYVFLSLLILLVGSWDLPANQRPVVVLEQARIDEHVHTVDDSDVGDLISRVSQ